jgi:hypothetical protein
LNNDLRADRINIRNISRRDLFALLLGWSIDFFNSTVERGRERVPEMEERIFVQTDIDKHRLQTHFDVLDAALVNRADDLARAAPLDAIFLETIVLEQSDPPLEFLDTDYQLVSGSA